MEDKFSLLNGKQLNRSREILAFFQSPRYTTTERDALRRPLTGQIIFNTTTGGINVYDGTFWVDISLTDGWSSPSSTIPTRSVSNDPTYEVTFAGVDLTGVLSKDMRVRLTQNGTIRYFRISKAPALDGADTDVTLYGGTDYDVDDTNTYPISALEFSTGDNPLGFPKDDSLWRLEAESTSTVSQSGPTKWIWYNVISLAIPIGTWEIEYTGLTEMSDTNTGYVTAEATLSTGAATESDSDNTTALGLSTSTSETKVTRQTVQRSNIFTFTTETTVYLNMNVDQAGMSFVQMLGGKFPTLIRATYAG